MPAGRAEAVAAPAGAKPEIRHQFRAPEKHPLALIPLTFAALQVPWLSHVMDLKGALWRDYAAGSSAVAVRHVPMPVNVQQAAVQARGLLMATVTYATPANCLAGGPFPGPGLGDGVREGPWRPLAQPAQHCRRCLCW